MAKAFKMSEILRAARPKIHEAINHKFKQLQPFHKKQISMSVWMALDGAIKVIEDCEEETEKKLNAKDKNPQPETAAGS